VPRHLGGRVLYRDGIVVATWVAGQLAWHGPVTLQEQHALRRALVREPDHGPVPLPAEDLARDDLHPTQ